MTNQIATSAFESPGELLDAEGRVLGTTPWMTVDADAVKMFVSATGGDRGSTGQVPPMMLLSLTNYFLPQLLHVGGISSGVNYGTGRVRFGEPARIGDRLRATATITEAAEVQGGVQTTVEIVLEAEGVPVPACQVESLSRWLT